MEFQTAQETAGSDLKQTLTGMTDEMRRCILDCTLCHQVCEHTLVHCLKLGGPHAEADHILAIQDCAQICQLAADLMMRGSEFHQRLCYICAEACRACAVECERFKDASMHECATICRHSAQSCERMVAVH